MTAVLAPTVGTVIVSIHDVHPSTGEACRELLRLVDRRRLTASLLVVPGPWHGVPFGDPGLVRWLQEAEARGHEIVQHGWAHEGGPSRSVRRRIGNRLLARGCAEFNELDESAAGALIDRGRAELDRFGFEPRGFVPPGWLASPGTVAALRRRGYEYRTSHLSIHDLVTDDVHRVPAVSQRPASRVSGLGAAAARRYGIHQIVARRPLRVALHPGDLTDARLRHSVECLLDATTCRPGSTYASWIDTARR